jgi:hypothetical protein
MMDMSRPQHTDNVTNPENTAQGVNVVCEGRHQTIFSMSVVMNMSVSTIQAIVQDLGDCIVWSQWVLCLLTHTRRNTCQHQWGSYSSTLLKSDEFLQQTAMGDETYHLSEGTRKPLGSPTKGIPSHKHLPRIWVQLFFFSIRDPLLLEFNTIMTKSMQS